METSEVLGVVAVLLIVGCFSGVGAAISSSRGYSARLGLAVGWLGLVAWLVLAFLPHRNAAADAAPLATSAAAFPRLERWLRVAHPLTAVLVPLVYALAVLMLVRPDVGRWVEAHPPVQALTQTLGAVAALAGVFLWAASLYLLVKDDSLPPRSRGPWTAALLFCSFVAALFFVPWRWRLHR